MDRSARGGRLSGLKTGLASVTHGLRPARERVAHTSRRLRHRSSRRPRSCRLSCLGRRDDSNAAIEIKHGQRVIPQHIINRRSHDFLNQPDEGGFRVLTGARIRLVLVQFSSPAPAGRAGETVVGLRA